VRVGRNGIIGPYWFEDADGHSVTVNTEAYVELMKRKFIPELRGERGVDMDTVTYQQDGASPHCSSASLEYLRRFFLGEEPISRRTDHPWLAHCPNLSHSDYFLWEYLKDSFYPNNLQTIDVLKNRHSNGDQVNSRRGLDKVIAKSMC